MSGGSYDYAYEKVSSMAAQLISSKETPLRRAFGEHLKKVANAMQAVEWVDSCDSAKGDEDEPIRACLEAGAEEAAARKALEEATEAKRVFRSLPKINWEGWR
jgi:hypothetical protein